jgi:hypothetical protein
VVTLGFHEPPQRMFPVGRKDMPAYRGNEIVIDFGWRLPDAGGAAPDMRPTGPEPLLGSFAGQARSKVR